MKGRSSDCEETIIVDIDNTIFKLDGSDYTKCKPKKRIINKLNKLYDKGFRIVYLTARGSYTGIDWEELTKKQFKEFGVKYTELLFNKPAYKYFIDDKAMTAEDFLKIKEVK